MRFGRVSRAATWSSSKHHKHEHEQCLLSRMRKCFSTPNAGQNSQKASVRKTTLRHSTPTPTPSTSNIQVSSRSEQHGAAPPSHEVAANPTTSTMLRYLPVSCSQRQCHTWCIHTASRYAVHDPGRPAHTGRAPEGERMNSWSGARLKIRTHER